MNDFDLTGKTVLLTGASGGIGQSIARKLTEHGAKIIITGRAQQKLEELFEGLNQNQKGSCLGYVLADLAASEDILLLSKQAQALSKVNVIVHCAGIVHPGPAIGKAEKEWDETFDVNLKAAFLLSQSLAPQMIKNGGGKIVMIGSTGGLRGLSDRAAYASSKGGMVMLTKQLAVEWGPENIQVNLIAPTVVMTPMAEVGWSDSSKRAAMLARIPNGRFPEPNDVANAVVYLSSRASDMVNGIVLVVDGGFSA